MRASLCFVLFLFLQSAFSRPVFDRDVHAVADEDGFYRQRSLKRSQELYLIDYTAKLAPGVVSLDKDQSVEEVICADALYIKTTETRNWKIGDILAGGPEWGCKAATGEPTLIAIRVMKIERNQDGLYRITGEHIDGKDLFEYLNVSMESTSGLVEENEQVPRQNPAITFPNFPTTIQPGKTTRIFIQIDRSQIAADAEIFVERDRKDLSGPVLPDENIATIRGDATYFDWTAPEVSNPVWANTFELSWSCFLGVCSKEIESPKFYIHKAVPGWSWNTNPDGSAIVKEIPFADLTCASVANTFCRIPKTCPACEVPNSPGKIQVSCRDCRAQLNAGINRFSIETSLTDVTNFTFDANLDFKANLEFAVQNTFEFSGEFQQQVITTTIYGIPSFSIAGLSINLGLYLDLDLYTKLDSPVGQSNGSVLFSADVKYGVFFNERTPLTVAVNGSWNTPKITALGNSEITAIYAVIPTFRVGIMTNPRALFAAIKPYTEWKLKTAYPPLPALEAYPASSLFKFGKEACAQDHLTEVRLNAGVNYTAGITLGIQAGASGRIAQLSLMSGCLFSRSQLDAIILTFEEEVVKSLNGSLIPILRKEITNVLNITAGEVLIVSEDSITARIVFISFQGGNSKKLADEYKKPESRIHYEVLLGNAVYSFEEELNFGSVILPSLLFGLLALLF